MLLNLLFSISCFSVLYANVRDRFCMYITSMMVNSQWFRRIAECLLSYFVCKLFFSLVSTFRTFFSNQIRKYIVCMVSSSTHANTYMCIVFVVDYIELKWKHKQASTEEEIKSQIFVWMDVKPSNLHTKYTHTHTPSNQFQSKSVWLLIWVYYLLLNTIRSFDMKLSRIRIGSMYQGAAGYMH